MQISAVLNAHREGTLALPSISSFQEAIDHARRTGIEVEPIIVVDRPDQPTLNVCSKAADWGATIHVIDVGDPGLSRNHGVTVASGSYITFLDADDLWSFNWIDSALSYVSKYPNVIGHSALNIVFGADRVVWVHADQLVPSFDQTYQVVANYWDSLCFVQSDVLRLIPYRKIDILEGWGHEDWDWNNLTIARGFIHRPVPGTIHMKRKRPGSQMHFCEVNDVVVQPSVLTSYSS